MDIVQPLLLKRLFDVFENQTSVESAFAAFTTVFFMLLAAKLFGWTMWRVSDFINMRFQPQVMASLEEGAFRYLLGHSYQFFADNFAGSLVKRVGRLSRAFEQLADEITFRFVPIAVILIGGFVGLYVQAPVMAYLFTAWTVLYLYFNYLAAKWAVKLDVLRTEIDSEVGGALADAISNAVTIKLFPALRFEVDRLKKVLLRYARAQTRSWLRHGVILAIQSLLMIAIETVLLYIGIQGWIEGRFTLGDLAFIQTYLIFAFAKLWEVGRSLRHLFDAFADSKEMVEIMMLPHAVRDHRGASELTVKKGRIEFKDVDFSFDRRLILDDFSLSIAAHEKVALVGPSGAGKSTITKLLFRFYDIQKGKIMIDGQDLSKVTQESLREYISLVPQDPVLFHRTLLDNIRYGRRDATDQEVIEAAKKAHCHDFINGLRHGYDTYVGERGVKLSGGERQRVAIARAILKNAPILVLDEATSSLDSESEALILVALRELMRDKTVIVIAHRLSTIMQMDRILVIEDGRLTHQGTHDELLSEAGTYQTLWNIQAGGFVG